MTRSPEAGRRSAMPATALALASSLLLPLAAMAVPIQAPSGAPAPGAGPAGAPDPVAGPRRPGVIPSTSISRDNGSNSDHSFGPRRPVPSRSEALTAEK